MSVIARLLCLISLSLLLTGCFDNPAGDRYFPLQEGLSWNYRVTTEYLDENESHQTQLEISSLGQQRFGEHQYYVRRTSSGIDYYINVDEQGVYRSGLRTLVELKPRLDAEKRFVLKYPLEPGTNWLEFSKPMILLNVFPTRQRITGINFPMSYSIESTSESVTVPAGTFANCIKVVGQGVAEMYTDGVNGFNEIPILVEEWYAPDVGLIKLVRYEMDGETIKVSETPAFLGGNTRLELIAFKD